MFKKNPNRWYIYIPVIYLFSFDQVERDSHQYSSKNLSIAANILHWQVFMDESMISFTSCVGCKLYISQME